jgi:hypothetical protein
MGINALLSELVVIADTLDKQRYLDTAADIDAALFILASDGASPLNKSLASLSREQYAVISDRNMSEDELDVAAAECVGEIAQLTSRLLDLKPITRLAVLQSIIQGMQSVLDPKDTLSEQSLAQGADFLAEAEKKLSQNDKLKGIGYRVGVIRAQIESING